MSGMHLEPSVRHTAKGFFAGDFRGYCASVYLHRSAGIYGRTGTDADVDADYTNFASCKQLDELFVYFWGIRIPKAGRHRSGCRLRHHLLVHMYSGYRVIVRVEPLPHMGHRINGTAFRGKPGAIFCGLGCRSDLQYSSKPASFRPLRFS